MKLHILLRPSTSRTGDDKLRPDELKPFFKDGRLTCPGCIADEFTLTELVEMRDHVIGDLKDLLFEAFNVGSTFKGDTVRVPVPENILRGMEISMNLLIQATDYKQGVHENQHICR